MGRKGAFNVYVKALHCFNAKHKLLYILFESMCVCLGGGGGVNCTVRHHTHTERTGGYVQMDP